jgi:hypothetical protein
MQWLERQRDTADLDPALLQISHLRAAERRIECLEVWRERLLIIKGLFEDLEPQGLLHLWKDHGQDPLVRTEALLQRPTDFQGWSPERSPQRQQL